jgi:hypothetical protein
MNAYQAYTIGFFTSSDDLTEYREIIDTLAAGDPEGKVRFWSLFDGMEPGYVAGLMANMTIGLQENFAPRGAYNRLLRVAEHLAEVVATLSPEQAEQARESLTMFKGV